MQSIKQNDVWQRGDKCLATWSGDGYKYKATIRDLQKSNNNSIVAIVKYDGYSEEETEEMDIKDLSKATPDVIVSSSDEPLFKPLQGNEDAIRIEEKYGSWDMDDDSQVSADQPKQKTGKRLSEMSIVIEGETWKNCKRGESVKHQKKTTRIFKKHPVSVVSLEKNKRKETLVGPSKLQVSARKEDCQRDQPGPSTSSEKISPHLSESVSPLIKAGTSGFDGFDESDLEKPQFNFRAIGKKIPYVLSKPESVPFYQVPANINQHLRDYQRGGINFLFRRYQKNQGAILGDDMGLGKTVQVIGFMSALLGKTGTKTDVWRLKPAFIQEMFSYSDEMDPSLERKPFLVIGPGCVLYNWLDELDTWGHFSVGKFHGSDKQQCLKDLSREKLEIVVTTFETFRDNKEYLNKVNWAAVIVDEVHRIKCLKAQTTQALWSIVCKRRYGLTGTALQNNMMELWCILDWACPGYLGSATEFEEKYVLPIEQGQKHNATKRQLANARKCKQMFSEIRNKIMIRRTKNLISDQLPKKDDNVVFCKLTDFQVSIYQTILQDPDLQDAINAGTPCFCGSRKSQGKCCRKKSSTGKPLKSVMFQFLHLLLKVSNHVALLAPDSKASSAQNQAAVDICNKVFEKHPHFLQLTQKAAFSTLSDPKYCCKMKVLVELLAVFHQNHSKVLLFSYSTRLLDILETYMLSTLYPYRRIDGKTSPRQRMKIVREFNKSPQIFVCLISTKAGGLGLNMTGANVVIIFDPNWNPSHDLQAQDRAYRIGQQRHVQVFRLISAGSIEENIYLRQVYKQQLDKIAVNTENAKRYFNGIQGDRQQKGELFGMKNMFQLRTGDNCLSKDILERNEQIEKQLEGHQVTKYVPSSSEEAAENNDEEDDYNDYHNNDSDDQENSEDSNEESSEDEDPYADWFSSLRDEIQETLGTSDEDNNNTDSKEKERNQPERKSNKGTRKKFSPNSKDNSKSHSKNDPYIDALHSTTTSHQSVPSFTDVFDRCGVVHVHENRKVTGGSRAEDHMTNCALQEVLQENKNSQQLAIECEPYQQSDSEEEEKKPRKRKSKTLIDHNTPQMMALNHYQVLYGQTPEAMLRKHLMRMANFLGFSSLQTLCQKVIGVSAEERLKMLQQFYISDHGHWLTPLFQSLPKPTAGKSIVTYSDDKAVSTKRRKVTWKVKPKITKPLPVLDSEMELEIGKCWKKSQHQTPQTRTRTKQTFHIKSDSISSKKKPSKVNFSIQEFHPTSRLHVGSDSHNQDQANITNIDRLLDEMALNAPSDVPHNNLSCSSVGKSNVFSEVDHIFLGSGSREGEMRKPPPKKRTRATNLSTERTSPESSRKPMPDAAEKVSSVSNSVDFLDDLLKNSTLKESVDNNTLWKKQPSSSKWKARQKFSDHVSQILEKDEKEYMSLFASGKMIRVNRPSVKEGENEAEGTPSLF